MFLAIVFAINEIPHPETVLSTAPEPDCVSQVKWPINAVWHIIVGKSIRRCGSTPELQETQAMLASLVLRLFIEWCFNTWYLPLMLSDEQWCYRVLFTIVSYSLFFRLHSSYSLILRFSLNSTLNWGWTWLTCHRPKWAILFELCLLMLTW